MADPRGPILRNKRRKRFPRPDLNPGTRVDDVPLSFAQERLWFLEQLHRVGSTYNESIILKLQGRLNLHALERTFSELIRRHEVLRTRIESVRGTGVQRANLSGTFN